VDEVKIIELWPCRYDAPAGSKTAELRRLSSHAASTPGEDHNANTSFCAPHAEQVSARERAKGQDIVKRGVGR